MTESREIEIIFTHEITYEDFEVALARRELANEAITRAAWQMRREIAYSFVTGRP